MRPNSSGNYNNDRRGRDRRSGTAVVEFAICLPIIVLIFLASIEICNAICLKQGATAAAYEASRVATNSGGTLATAELRANEVLGARSITGATVAFNPAAQEDWNRGSDIQVTVSIPSSNLGTSVVFFQSRPITTTITMVKQ